MKPDALAKRMNIAILVISVLCVVGSLVYYRSLQFLPFFYGVLLGAAASLVKVFLLKRAVTKALSPDVKNAGFYITGQNLLRFALTALALVAGALIDGISLWGVVAGILSYQIAVYVANFTAKREEQIHGSEH